MPEQCKRPPHVPQSDCCAGPRLRFNPRQIILRARQNHLQEKYAAKVRENFTADTLKELEGIFVAFVADKLLPKDATEAAKAAPWGAVQQLPNLGTLLRDNAKFKMHHEAAVRRHAMKSRRACLHAN